MPSEIDRSLLDQLYNTAYPDLLRLASPLVGGGADLDAEDLVAEAYLALAHRPPEPNASIAEATDMVAKAMRRIVVDHVRSASSEPAIQSLQAIQAPDDRIMTALREALSALKELFPETEKLIEAKFLGGLTHGEAAEALGTSSQKIGREWEFAKLWLQRELGIPVSSSEPQIAPHHKRAKYSFVTSESKTTLVRVFYATDRKLVEAASGPEYVNERSLMGALTFGECEISIPKAHVKGKRESPRRRFFRSRADSTKHIVLANIKKKQENDFWDNVAKSINESDAKDAFVFIHGYNVSFEDAARTTGQLAFDLEFQCAPILYSWPANGNALQYPRDETEISWTVAHLKQFLLLLFRYSGAERIHLIAHSMGNRAVCEALRILNNDERIPIRFNNLILAAPDIDAETFRELAGDLKRLSGRVTLYQSSNDKALKFSKTIHRYRRAGEPVLVTNGVDTVDASSVDTDYLGHSYYSESRELLRDIHSIVFKDEPPSRRFGLMELDHDEGVYYTFRL